MFRKLHLHLAAVWTAAVGKLRPQTDTQTIKPSWAVVLRTTRITIIDIIIIIIIF